MKRPGPREPVQKKLSSFHGIKILSKRWLASQTAPCVYQQKEARARLNSSLAT